MELDLIQIISLLVVFVNLLLAGFLLAIKSDKYMSNLLLAAFLIVSAEDSDIIFIAQFVYPNYPALGMLINSIVLLKMPLLYLYILSIIYSDFRIKPVYILHGLPFLLINILLIPRFYAQDFTGQIEFLTANTLTDRQPEIMMDYILLHIQILVYFIACFLAVAKYKGILLENFSNAGLFNYKWLFQLLVVLAIESFVASIKNVFMFMGLEGAYFYALLTTSLLSLVYVIWMILRTMQHPELFRGIDSRLQLVKRFIQKESPQQTFGNSIVLGEAVDEKVNLLNKYMHEKEPYLDPSLTIYNLSTQIDIPTRDLSLLINHHLNQHFFDFVNGFRIRKAMAILRDPDRSEFTILEILYEVGFNSKSSFNTAFKKYTNLTPTEYRRKYLTLAA